MPETNSSFGSLLDMLYTAASQAGAWSHFLAAVAAALEAKTAGLILHDPDGGRYSVVEQFGSPEHLVQDYRDHYGKFDVLFPPTSQLRPGYIQLSHEAVTMQRLRSSYYYNDFMRPHDLLYQCGVVIERDGERVSTFTALRGHGAEPFSEADFRLLDALTPHLRRAFALQRRFAVLKQSGDLLGAAFDADPRVMFILAPSLRILLANKAAETYVAGSSRLRIKQNCVEMLAPQEQERLKQGVTCACALTANAEVQTFQFREESGDEVHVTITHFPVVTEGITTKVAALVMLESHQSGGTSLAAMLVARYRLTRAETRVVLLLAEGHSLAEVGAELHVTRNTLKSQLRAIYDKTGFRRQSALLLSLQRLGKP